VSDELRVSLRLLRGFGEGKPKKCPRCKRQVVPRRRHKECPDGPWCSGTADPKKEMAGDAMRRVHQAVADAYLSKDYDLVIALCIPVIEMLEKPKT
jgi:hypothetical protein